MNYKDLMEYLDIEDGSELRYFEEIADLIESDEHIDYDALLRLFEEVDRDAVAELLDEYFNDVTDVIPEEYSELFSLLEQIRMELTGVIRSITDDDPESVRNFTDRFYRFRNWYVYDSVVNVQVKEEEDTGIFGREYEQSVRDAIATARAGRFDSEEYAFDFSMALDYDIDYYEMSFSDLISSVDQDETLN